MQSEPTGAQPSPSQNPPSDPAAQQRAQYTALITAMREQNKQIVTRELQYLDAQIKAGELTTDSNDYRYRLDAIDVMRRSCYSRGAWDYGPDADGHARTQAYTLTLDSVENIWVEWDGLPAGGAAAGWAQPAGKRLYMASPDAR
jgi:hypothetical protein